MKDPYLTLPLPLELALYVKFSAWRSLAGLHLQQYSLLQITTMKELIQQSIPNVKADKPQHLNCHT